MTRSLLLLLCAHDLIVLLSRTRSCAAKQRVWGINRNPSFEALQALFRELELSLELVDPIDFGGNIGYFGGQDFDADWVANALVHCSGTNPAQTKVISYACHDGDDALHATLQSADGRIDLLNFPVEALDSVVIERDLLFEADNGSNHIRFPIAWSPAMLIIECSHRGAPRMLVEEADPYTRAPPYFYQNSRHWEGQHMIRVCATLTT